MEPIYRKEFTISGLQTDRFGNLKTSAILYFVQQAAGEHCDLLQVSWEDLQRRSLFWAIIRHRVQITRLPKKGETITVETWPMPTTRTAFPRSVLAYDSQGQELFRTISLWVLMDPNTRAMVLPQKSGIQIEGVLRGTELTVPGGLMPRSLADHRLRPVCFTDLDANGHMNNGRYLDWIWDLLPSGFHQYHQPRELTMCYMAEAREGDALDVKWAMSPEGQLQVEITRQDVSTGQEHRIFSANIAY